MPGGLANSRHAPPEWRSQTSRTSPKATTASTAVPAAAVVSGEPTVTSPRTPAAEPFHHHHPHPHAHHGGPHRGPHPHHRHPPPSSGTPSVANGADTTTSTTTAVPGPSTGGVAGPGPGSGPGAAAAGAPAPRPAAAARAAPHHELARYAKIMRRLQWKLPFLAQGYRLAVDHRLGADPAAVAEAELMFKLDFFEYYMLIERALVHLLGVFGIEVPRGGGVGPAADGGGGGGGGGNGGQPHEGENNTNNTNNHHPNLSASRWSDAKRSRHRYHANVLAALDNPGNPLHAALGTGEVRAQLARAKDLRNRWKTAGDEEEEETASPPPPQPAAATGEAEKAKETQNNLKDPSTNSRRGSRSPTQGGNGGGGGGGRASSPEWRPTKKVAAPLDSYRLEHMLEVIFGGLGEAFKIAEAHVRGSVRWGDEDDEEMLEALDWAAAADDEKQWDFMVDAMDWEAV